MVSQFTFTAMLWKMKALVVFTDAFKNYNNVLHLDLKDS